MTFLPDGRLKLLYIALTEIQSRGASSERLVPTLVVILDSQMLKIYGWFDVEVVEKFKT